MRGIFIRPDPIHFLSTLSPRTPTRVAQALLGLGPTLPRAAPCRLGPAQLLRPGSVAEAPGTLPPARRRPRPPPPGRPGGHCFKMAAAAAAAAGEARPGRGEPGRGAREGGGSAHLQLGAFGLPAGLFGFEACPLVLDKMQDPRQAEGLRTRCGARTASTATSFTYRAGPRSRAGGRRRRRRVGSRARAQRATGGGGRGDRGGRSLLHHGGPGAGPRARSASRLRGRAASHIHTPTSRARARSRRERGGEASTGLGASLAHPGSNPVVCAFWNADRGGVGAAST